MRDLMKKAITEGQMKEDVAGFISRDFNDSNSGVIQSFLDISAKAISRLSLNT